MPTGAGYRGILGVGVESVWGTEVAASQRVPYRGNPLSAEYARLADQALEGRGAMRVSDQGMVDVANSIPTTWRYTTTQRLLEQFFGDLTSGTYGMQETNDGISVTLAEQKTVSVWAWTGCKVSQIVIAGTPDDQVMVTYDVIAQDETQASAQNTTNSLAALTDIDAPILLTDLNFRIGPLGAALDGDDEYGVAGFTVTVQRPQAITHNNQARTILEPVDSGRRVCTLALDIPRYTTNQWQTWKNNNTTLQARLYFTDGSNTKEILLPEIKLLTVSNPTDGPELLTTPVTAECARNLNNSDMVTGQVEVEINET